MSDLETFRPQCELPEVQRSLKQCFRLFKLSTLEADACQPIERTNCLGMFRLSSLLPDAQSPLIQQFGLIVSTTFTQIICRFPQDLSEILVPALIRHGSSTCQRVRQEALTLFPGFVGGFRKCRIQHGNHLSHPHVSLLSTHKLAQYRLHQAMEGERLCLWMSLYERQATQGCNGLVELSLIGCDRLQH